MDKFHAFRLSMACYHVKVSWQNGIIKKKYEFLSYYLVIVADLNIVSWAYRESNWHIIMIIKPEWKEK